MTQSVRLTFSPAALAEIHALPDDALVDTHAAAAVLDLSPNSLTWYRSQGGGPEFIKLTRRCVRYRMGVLRAFVASRPQGGGAQ